MYTDSGNEFSLADWFRWFRWVLKLVLCKRIYQWNTYCTGHCCSEAGSKTCLLLNTSARLARGNTRAYCLVHLDLSTLLTENTTGSVRFKTLPKSRIKDHVLGFQSTIFP